MNKRPSTLCELITWSRESHIFSKSELARRSNLSYNTIFRLEKGDGVNRTTLVKVAKALDLQLNDLMDASKIPHDLPSNVVRVLGPINDELIKYLAKHPERMYSISPRKFEYLVAEILRDMGAEVEITKETRDGGRDILAAIATPIGKLLTIVECKRLSPERKIGLDVAERFLWTIDNKDKASCGLIATTSYFSREAILLRDQYRWKLKYKDFEGLSDWLSQYGKWSHREKYGLWLPRMEIEDKNNHR
ncbi:MAG: restriction endonuclease [Candidatus Zixiibacteriota bacterium]